MKTKHFELNTKGTDYFLGDLHGMYDEFMAKLAEVHFNVITDRVFCVGDLADRGPNPVECINLLKESWFHCVKGNHEDFLLGSHSRHIWTLPVNGGEWSNTITPDKLKELANLIINKAYDLLTVNTLDGKIGVVHAESTSNWEDNSELSFGDNRWARTKIRAYNKDSINGIDLVVVGHTPLKRVVKLGNVVYIDTGACFEEGYLTMLNAKEIFKQ